MTEEKMETYIVRPKIWAYGWELHIESVGVTQCYKLTAEDAGTEARAFIAECLGVAPGSFRIKFVITKTEKRYRAREIREQLARYLSLQQPYMQRGDEEVEIAPDPNWEVKAERCLSYAAGLLAELRFLERKAQ